MAEGLDCLCRVSSTAVFCLQFPPIVWSRELWPIFPRNSSQQSIHHTPFVGGKLPSDGGRTVALTVALRKQLPNLFAISQFLWIFIYPTPRGVHRQESVFTLQSSGDNVPGSIEDSFSNCPMEVSVRPHLRPSEPRARRVVSTLACATPGTSAIQSIRR